MNTERISGKNEKLQLKIIKELSKEITSSKQKAENFLKTSGILDFVEKNTEKSKKTFSKNS